MTKKKTATTKAPKAAKPSLVTAARHVLSHLSPDELTRVVKEFTPKASPVLKKATAKAPVKKAVKKAKRTKLNKVVKVAGRKMTRVGTPAVDGSAAA